MKIDMDIKYRARDSDGDGYGDEDVYGDEDDRAFGIDEEDEFENGKGGCLDLFEVDGEFIELTYSQILYNYR